MPAIQSEPQSRERNKVRLPLDHSETEALARRIDRLVGLSALNDDERASLLKSYHGLRKADRLLAHMLCDRPLPATNLRPCFWDEWSRIGSACLNKNKVEVCTGFVLSTRDIVAELESKYAIRFAEYIADDDI